MKATNGGIRQIHIQRRQIRLRHCGGGNPIAYRQDLRTSKILGTETLGSRETSQITGCQNRSLSDCSKRLLGGYRFRE
jgi:hypothetical protein